MAELTRLQHSADRLTQFLGVNLRRDRLSLADEECARAINLDLHSQVGTPQLRKGRQQVGSVSGAVVSLWSVGTDRYAIAGGVLYKNGTSVVSGLTSAYPTLWPQRPVNDPLSWVFLADTSGMKAIGMANGAYRNWGIVPPTVAPLAQAGGGTGLSGDYSVSYTYLRKSGTAICHESNPSPTSNTVTLANQDLDVTGILASSDPQVTHIRLYRTVGDGSARLFDQELPNATASTTSTQDDFFLGAEVEVDNNRPPLSQTIVGHQEHIFFLDPANPAYVWWSKRYQPESVPTRNFLDVGTAADPLWGLVSLVGILGLFSARTKYRVLGSDTSGFVAQEALSARGTVAPQCALASETGCLFVARDGLFRTDFYSPDTEMSQVIAPLWEGLTINDYAPINFGAAAAMRLAYWKQRLYFAYASGAKAAPDMLAVYSFHTQHWYFWELPCTALSTEAATDLLVCGTEEGVVASLETGTTDLGAPIALVFEPASRFAGAYMVRKRFDYLRVDYDAGGASLLVEVYIDDVLTDLWSLTGSSRRLLRLRGAEGFVWRVRVVGSSTQPISLGGIEMQAVVLGAH